MLMMFYLNVFYLPTLKDVGHYKLQNEVMFWFTETLCYNVYIPLLIRQANDVEENPGPPIFDIIDPTTTVSADFSQGNEALFGVNAGFPASRGLSREGRRIASFKETKYDFSLIVETLLLYMFITKCRNTILWLNPSDKY